MDIPRELIKIAKLLTSAKKTTEAEVIKFLSENKNPSDAELHKWAEGKGYDVHEVETLIYTLATKFANFMTEGKAPKSNFTIDDVDPKELELGRKVEKEHASDPGIIDRIILDHCAAVPDYYSNPKAAMKDLEAETKG